MIIFIQTPIKHTIYLDTNYIETKIYQKHPSIKNSLKVIIDSLIVPFTIRKSTKDENVFLYYIAHRNKILCTVIKFSNNRAYLITAYHCDTVKKGDIVWQK